MSQIDDQHLTNHSFNPVKGKLASIQECLTQLREVLPASKDEYISADRMTHSFVKSCFLMTIQRAIDINCVIIETTGKRLPHNKPRTFFLIWQTGSVDDETLSFFQSALECYKKMVNPYDDLSDIQIYEVARALLKHGKEYIRQINEFFAGTSQMPMSLRSPSAAEDESTTNSNAASPTEKTPERGTPTRLLHRELDSPITN